MPTQGNLFADLPPPGGDEAFETLLERPGTRIERIVSHGHASPAGFWYDQAQTEWVIVIRGEAVLRFEDGERRALSAGDWTTIAPHRRHRVESTGPATIWLAVHVDSR